MAEGALPPRPKPTQLSRTTQCVTVLFFLDKEHYKAEFYSIYL